MVVLCADPRGSSRDADEACLNSSGNSGSCYQAACEIITLLNSSVTGVGPAGETICDLEVYSSDIDLLVVMIYFCTCAAVRS